MIKNPCTISPISEGQYNVIIYLDEWMHAEQISKFKKLFKDALEKLRKIELNRLNSYEFAKNAFWIFTQSSSYRYVKSLKRCDHWPIRGKGSSGVKLRGILLKLCEQ